MRERMLKDLFGGSNATLLDVVDDRLRKQGLYKVVAETPMGL